MSCRPPFVGASAAAHCPLGNTDPFQKPLIDAKSVRCRLECPLRVPAEDIPDGYELSADRASLSVDQGTTNNNINKNLSWKCAEGFVGDALKHCNASKICNASDTSSECAPAVDLQFEFVGCKPVQPCAMAVLDPCKHNQAVGCPGGVGGLLGPGQSCEVMCRPPFTGPSSVARCPANNTLLFGGGLQFQLPGCEVEQCHDPVPPGYMRTFDGWECAEGWIGRAVRGCATDANCEPEVALSGCAQLLPCKVPASADKCRWNFTACAEARNGATCEIHCQSPFYRPDSLLGGRSSTGSARCAAGNADPNRELEVLFPPQCTAACEEPPAGPPLGFVTEGTAQKLPTNNNNSSSTGYRCAESFAGEARAECVVAPDPASLATSGAFFCRATLNFSGCSPRTACAALPLLPAGSNNNSSSSKCKFDAFSCGILQAGTQCPVPCKAPYSGSPGYALCHLNNTDSTAPPLLREPTCSLPALCEDPVPLPAGYVLPSAGGIACAKGYAGRAQRSCLVHEETGCQLTAVFSGCLKLSPCLLPAIPASDCELDASACDAGGRLEPGASCEVTCRTPLQGTPATVRCPASNTDERFAATWTAPICGCPDPKSVPLGYIKAADLWTCAGGFVGRAVKNCLCGAAAPMLSGCTPPVSCGAAGFVDDDARQGYVSGVLHFGPASLGEVMDEFGVSYYEVFLADDCGVPVSSKPLAEVLPRTVGGTYHGLWPISCCKGDVYAVSLASMALPSNAAKFLIVARTASGPTPDGLLVPLEDFNYESSGRSGNKTIVGNAAAPRSQNWRLLFATAAAAASWQVVSTTTETPVFG
ncbi:unnamed protein product [Polarella glacialis]|uniref:Uncharacterized protein n=1 Tax=Polarella glacialis TaxID=89957 RepID=A0A813DHG9_POLGL|nr:unnamed protein product [Polarella glacialis]